MAAAEPTGVHGLDVRPDRWQPSCQLVDAHLRRECVALGSVDTERDRPAVSMPVTSSRVPSTRPRSAMAALVLHLNRETMHHGGEIGVLRDLYRATGAMSRQDHLVVRRPDQAP
jgi:hypothetical protein